ncbi:MAG: nuclear transport factor 2 family protein [Armatimonadota bacterium]
MKPDFTQAVRRHLDAISNRDIETYRNNITSGETMYTVVQNGHAFTTPAEIISIHEEWFKDLDWTWDGEIIHTVEGEDMAMALIKYVNRPKPDGDAHTSWLIYVFKLEDGMWRIVHDQNTSLDYPTFARLAGL